VYEKSKCFLCRAAIAAVLLFPTAAHASLVGFYTFNGSTADSSGNGNNGVLTGTATFTNNAPFGGQAIQFDGVSNSFVTVPINTSPAALPQVTYGGWVLASQANAVIRGVISNDDGNFDRTIDVDTRNGGLQWSAFIGGSVVANTAVVPGAWTFVAVRFDQATNSYSFDVGANRISCTTNFDTNSVTSGTTIGRNPNFDSPFGGEFADVFFFNQVLTNAQIDAIRVGGPTAVLDAAGAVPEPGTFLLSGLLLVFGAIGRRRFSKA